ncbi:hypothetical protein MBLNU13_g05205t1 [Cladosporium sp. NU13]
MICFIEPTGKIDQVWCVTISIFKIEEVIEVGEAVVNRVGRAIDTSIGCAFVTDIYIVEISYSVFEHVDPLLKYVRRIEGFVRTSVVSRRSQVTSIQIAFK